VLYVASVLGGSSYGALNALNPIIISELYGNDSHRRICHSEAAWYILYGESLVKYTKRRLSDSAACDQATSTWARSTQRCRFPWPLALTFLPQRSRAPLAPGSGASFTQPCTFSIKNPDGNNYTGWCVNEPTAGG
jgi:hypothetical protein